MDREREGEMERERGRDRQTDIEAGGLDLSSREGGQNPKPQTLNQARGFGNRRSNGSKVRNGSNVGGNGSRRSRYRGTSLISNTPPYNPTVGLCLGPYGARRRGGGFL